jgi:FkbM family methyltransferase
MRNHTYTRNPLDYLIAKFHASRTAGATLDACRELGFRAELVVDCGANANQVTRYWLREWPDAKLVSIEANRNCRPAGQVIHTALGSTNGTARFHLDGGRSHIDQDGGVTVTVKRFDSLGLDIPERSIVKVDCETSTYEALLGMGAELSKFRLAHVEVNNDDLAPRIYGLMAERGFTAHRVTDASGWRRSISFYDVLFLREAGR